MKYASLKIFVFLIVLFFIVIIPFSHVSIADEEPSTSSEIISNGNFSTCTNFSLLGITPSDWNLSEYFNYDSDNKYIFSSIPNSTASQSKILPVGIYEFSVSAQTDSTTAEIIVSARAYLKYIINENTYYAYANYEENKHCRSVYEIAERAKQDVEDSLITETETLAAIDEYLNKIQTTTYIYAEDESTEILEKDSGKIYYFDFTAEKSAIMQIIPEIDESVNADFNVSVYANEETLTPKNGYYLLPANSEIKICFKGKNIFNIYVCPIKTVTVKLYLTE